SSSNQLMTNLLSCRTLSPTLSRLRVRLGGSLPPFTCHGSARSPHRDGARAQSARTTAAVDRRSSSLPCWACWRNTPAICYAHGHALALAQACAKVNPETAAAFFADVL